MGEIRQKDPFPGRHPLAEKIDRKQLKRPDEFQVVAGKAMDWLIARQRQVVTILVAVAVVALAAWGFSLWRGSREAKAGGELAEALELQSRPVAGEGPTQPGQETFPSKEERDKAVIIALEKVRSEHSGSTAALTAQAELGFHRLSAGDPAGAEKDLQAFLGNAPKDHPLRVFAQESLGYALEAQKKYDDAAAAFSRLRDYDLPARADFQAARLALLQGKPDAKAQLEKVAKDYPKETEVARQAEERVELASLPPMTAATAEQKPAEAPKATETPKAPPAKAKPAPKPAPKKKK
jgi:tetratricopeptide (TPR) repeat protein